ncbi:hypothetical protein ACFL0R_02760 [Pseudomonadota bacterium]
MKAIKWLFIVVGLTLTTIWVWTITPANAFMPDVLKEFMIIFGGILTYLVPMMVVIMIVIWLDARNQNRDSAIDGGGPQ